MQFLSVTEDFVAFAFPRRPHLSEEALMAVVILSEAKDLNRRSTKFAAVIVIPGSPILATES